MKKSTFRRLVRHIKNHTKKDILILVLSLFCLVAGGGIVWVSSFRLPDLSSFDQRIVSESTKIYDRTGKVLLYDFHDGIKRTVVASADISPFIKDATVSIEDEDFYSHHGIKITSIIRAILANIVDVGYSQGGSTITQQVVKNTLLTKDKTITRKLKEWVLAVKLDRTLSKERILEIYLNETAYGGSIYGVEEAAKQFFNKDAKDVTLAEAAYLAAIPQATTYFSPYGKNTDKLEERKNLVLKKMLGLGHITNEQYTEAKTEKVSFEPQGQFGIKAPHFVFFVKNYLESILGENTLDSGGYKIITTLDANLEEKAEDLVKTTAFSNETNFNASNAALVALDPETGDILSMVGSRDYFDTKIDGQFNVATASNRQPGSTMKPIIYSEAFLKGYTPDTVLFDLQTEFSSECTSEGKPISPTASTSICYMPQNYDGLFRGPITLRNALAQSINVPSIKTLYLAGIKDSLGLAKDMGITSLTNADQYGLTLVLGGGEVSLLEMTSAYGVFAHDGVRVPYRSVLHIFDSKGAEIPLPIQKQTSVMPANIARTISDILSDNIARTPAYGANSVLYFPTRDVAVKTGTTNNSIDAWTVGYTPNLVVGVWAGNNDYSPMVKKVAGQIVAPMWSSFMKQALTVTPDERFIPPTPSEADGLKPVMKGIWQGGKTYTIDSISGKLATNLTPSETTQEKAIQSVHSILYWVNKKDPLGPAPENPSDDPQFEHWETPVRAWAAEEGLNDEDESVIPKDTDDVHTASNPFSISLQTADLSRKYSPDETVSVLVSSNGRFPLAKASLYVNNDFIETIDRSPFIFKFNPKNLSNMTETNQIKVIATDSVFNKTESSSSFSVNLDN